jgi:NADH-quinone oxidoreductase subunit A
LYFFDVEVIFLYPRVNSSKELGIEGMVKMVKFLLLLIGSYIIKEKL